MSGPPVSPAARHVIVDLVQPDHPSMARIMRHVGLTRRAAKRIIAELVELAWMHRQHGTWEPMPAGRNAAAWYLAHEPEVPGA